MPSFYFLVFLTFLIVLFSILIYTFLFNDEFSLQQIKNNIDHNVEKFKNTKLEALLNGSSIYNIPKLNIITTNENLRNANDCTNGPVFINKLQTITDDNCKQFCVNDTGKVIHIYDTDNIIYQNTKLNMGSYCTIGPRPNCNSNTSIAILTINSVECKSRFPNLIGGPLGTTVIACNNNQLPYNVNNILYDMLVNQPVNVYSTIFISENEKLPNGQYRFQCVFNGVDNFHNQYIEHPFNRFHPIKNPCTKLIKRAHPDIKIKYNDDKTSYECDCGNELNTRVKNLYPNDKSSACANETFEVIIDKNYGAFGKTEIKIVYDCFNVYSSAFKIATALPCPPDQFLRDGSEYHSVKYEAHGDYLVPIGHPLYKEFKDKTHVLEDKFKLW